MSSLEIKHDNEKPAALPPHTAERLCLSVRLLPKPTHPEAEPQDELENICLGR